MCYSESTGSKVIFLLVPVAILAAILWISQIAQGYPLDIRYRGPTDIESSERKNYISQCRIKPQNQL